MTPTISSLLSRVRAASGQLDDETLAHVIAVAVGKIAVKWRIVTGDDGSDEFRVDFSDGSWPFSEYRSRCPDVSIDAAVALVDLSQNAQVRRVECFLQGEGVCHLSSPIRPEGQGTSAARALRLRRAADTKPIARSGFWREGRYSPSPC